MPAVPSVSVEPVGGVGEVGAKLVVAPAGAPLVASETAAAKPLIGASATAHVWLPAPQLVRLYGVTSSVNSGTSTQLLQTSAKSWSVVSALPGAPSPAMFAG